MNMSVACFNISIIPFIYILIVLLSKINAQTDQSLFYLKLYDSKDLVLDVADRNPCSGANVILCPKGTMASQLWEFYNGNMIRNYFNGHFLSIDTAKVDSAVLWPPYGKEGQTWYYNHYYNRFESQNKKCLNAEGVSTGSRITGKECNVNGFQKFEIVLVD
ncbi:hypothetical protein CHUAL_007646 [Chamberlinius hualienensis]